MDFDYIFGNCPSQKKKNKNKHNLVKNGFKPKVPGMFLLEYACKMFKEDREG